MLAIIIMDLFLFGGRKGEMGGGGGEGDLGLKQ